MLLQDLQRKYAKDGKDEKDRCSIEMGSDGCLSEMQKDGVQVKWRGR